MKCDCGVLAGQNHREGCNLELCPFCGKRLNFDCECDPKPRGKETQSIKRQQDISLRGVKGVGVQVHYPRAEAGLTEGLIRSDIEQKLRLAGIEVLSKEQTKEEPGRPILFAVVTAFPVTDSFIFIIRLEFYQRVLLGRDNKISVNGATWLAGGLIASPSFDRIRDSLKEHVDKFINAYLSVNPNRESKRQQV